jgi:hypothetical protein
MVCKTFHRVEQKITVRNVNYINTWTNGMEEWVRKSMKNIFASISFEFIWLMMSIFHFVLVKGNFSCFLGLLCTNVVSWLLYFLFSRLGKYLFYMYIYIRCLTLSTTVTVKMLSIFKNLLLIRNSRNIQIRCSLHNLYDISNFYPPAIILLFMLMSLSTALML